MAELSVISSAIEIGSNRALVQVTIIVIHPPMTKKSIGYLAIQKWMALVYYGVDWHAAEEWPLIGHID